MLILTRKESERVCLGDHITLTIVRLVGDKVRIGVEAPPHIRVLRTELEIDLSILPESSEVPSASADPEVTTGSGQDRKAA
jgi:carbon storage regulator